MVRSRRIALAVLVCTVIATTAGTNVGGAPAPPDPAPSEPTKPPVPTTATTDRTKAPTDTTAVTASPSTTAPARSAVATALPIDLGMPLDDAWAAEFLGPAFGRGYLVIGASQAPGQVVVPRIWDSPDGLTWADAPAPVAPAGAVWRSLGGGWIGDRLVVWGEAATTGRPSAALWWSGDGRNFADPPEAPFGDRWSTVTQVALGPNGPIAVGYDEAAEQPLVATRDPAGTWVAATVPDRALFRPAGLAVRDATVVITGIDDGGEVGQAGAMISVDGGAAFAPADTTALTGGFFNGLGEVAAVSTGFVAAACMTSPDGTVTGLARSVDGVTWVRQDLVPRDASQRLPTLYNTSCGSIATDGTQVYFGLDDLGSWSLEVSPDGTFDPLEFARPDGRIGGYALVLPTAAGLIGIVDEYGGMYASNRQSGAIGSGLPAGHPLVSDVGVEPLGTGTAVSVSTYPEITELGDGLWRRAPARHWFDGNGTPLVVPDGTVSVTATPFGDIALASRDDPDDTELGGPIGGTAIVIREADGSWTELGLIAGGAGGQALTDVVVTPSGLLAIGYGSVRIVNGPTTTRPLVFASPDGRTWTAETPPVGDSTAVWFQVVEQVGDRTVLLGHRLRDGMYAPFVMVRDGAGTWTEVAAVGLPLEVAFEAAAEIDGRLLIAVRSNSGVELVVSDDLVNFTVVEVPEVFDEVSLGGIEAIGGRFVLPGTELGSTDADGAIWASDDGVTWRHVVVDGLDGPGSQGALTITADATGELIVGGIDNLTPMVWRLPADALD
ncbi:MAG: hypothetical protein ACK5OX_08985 [Desertimonas sp.]